MSVSQRQVKTVTDLFYEIVVGIVQGNFGTITNAGSTAGTQRVKRYGLFKNLIYVGAQSDMSTDTSFAGYLKEFQLYTSFRGLAQMQDSYSRTMRLYSYDDRQLVAYWKFTELFT